MARLYPAFPAARTWQNLIERDSGRIARNVPMIAVGGSVTGTPARERGLPEQRQERPHDDRENHRDQRHMVSSVARPAPRCEQAAKTAGRTPDRARCRCSRTIASPGSSPNATCSIASPSEGSAVLLRRVGRSDDRSRDHGRPETGVLEAFALMTKRRISHLPVARAASGCTGFVSIGDLVKHRIELVEAEAEQMRQYIQTA